MSDRPTRNRAVQLVPDLASLEYLAPASAVAALAALSRPGARLLAGGTDLIPALRRDHPWTAGLRCLVDLRRLPGARGIRRRGSNLRFGALETAGQLSESALVRRLTPALWEAAVATAAPQVRSQATIGGNLMTPHPAGDIATALLGLGATALVVDRLGRRRLSVDALLRVRNRRLVVLAVEVRVTPRSAFLKLSSRRGFGRALAAAVVAIQPDGAARVALSASRGCGPRPILGTSRAMGRLDHETGPLVAALIARARQVAERR